LKKFIITLGIRVFLLYCLYLLLFKGLNFVFPAYGSLVVGFQELIRHNLLNTTAWFLEHTGNISVSQNADTLYFNDQFSLKIVDNCLGIKLMFIYAMLIVAYPGAKIKNKLWYIPMGIAILHLLNIIRTIVLSFVIIYTNSFDFVHEFVFRVLFYGITFVLWYIWIKKYVDQKKFENNSVLDESQSNPENK
jgi:exosortase/archaeosortase family protein